MMYPAVGRGNTRVIAASTQEPITLDEAIAHLRLYPDDVDTADLASKITEARASIEDYIGRALAPQVLEWVNNQFPTANIGHGCYRYGSLTRYRGFGVDADWSYFELPMPPVISVASITYLDEDGADQVWDPTLYRLDNRAQPAVIYLPHGGTWPVVRAERNAIRIIYHAGYDSTGASPDNNPIPPPVRAAIKLMLGHLWENREAVTDGTLNEIPLGICNLLVPYQTQLNMA